MEPTATNPGGVPPAPPATDGAAVAAETAALLGRYLAGDSLTAREFGLVGKHYKSIGKPVPKEQRKAVLEKTRIGTAVAASAILADNPPPVDPVAALAPAPAASPDQLALASSVARSLLGTGEKFLTRKALRTAEKLGADEKTKREIVESAKTPPEAVELIVQPLPALAAKYGVPLENLPEVSFIAGLAQVGIGWLDVFNKLDELEKAADARAARAKPKTEADVVPMPQPAP